MEIEEKLLTVNEWSRPHDKLSSIDALVVHWAGNPQTSAEFNWNYFENRKYGGTSYGSTQYIVGLHGEIIRMIPDDEVAYHVGALEYTPYAIKRWGRKPNQHTIGIETCHIDWDGHYSTRTLEALAQLIKHLCKIHHLNPVYDVIRHYDVTGKDCPRFFVNRPDAWDWYKYAIEGAAHRRV